MLPPQHAAAAVGSKRKRSEVYALLLSPEAKAARMGSPMGGGAAGGGGGGSRRPAENADEVRTHVNVLYRWEWRAVDGTYVACKNKILHISYVNDNVLYVSQEKQRVNAKANIYQNSAKRAKIIIFVK